MAKGAKNPISKAVVYVVLLLLIVGLAGFGATNFGGSTRVVGSVGDTEIGIDRYARALDQEIRAIEAETGERLSIAEARERGIDRAVLQRLVALVALEDEAADLGLSVGDAAVAEQIRRIPSFQGMDGDFDREAYRFALDRLGLTAAEFEEQLRDETARSILQGALVAGIQPPGTFVDVLYDYAREMRDLTFVTFGPDALEGDVPEPTEEQIVAHYEANAEAYTLPRRKRITYAWASPEMVTDSVEVSEDALRRLYEERSGEYNQPERRLVERLVFPDMDAAEAARASLDAGEAEFDALVTERGLDLSDVDLGQRTRESLGPAGEAVFALEEPGIAGPVETALGAALYRVNAILSARSVPFEEARAELRDEYAVSAAARALQDLREPVADLLAGGATLEEVAAETELELDETVWSPGESGVAGAEIDAYEEFRALALETEPGDFPEVAELSDGGLFALRVDDILEPELQPLDAVRAEVIRGWTAEAVRQRLTEQAEAALAQIRDGAAPADTGGGLRREQDVLRDEAIEGLPQEIVPAAFDLENDGAAVLPTQNGAVIVMVDAVTVPGGATEEARAVKQGVRQAAGQGIAEDVAAAFTRALQANKGISLDQTAVNAVLSQFN